MPFAQQYYPSGMQPSDTDITDAAIALVREHGDRAPIYAAMEADRLSAAGDLDAAANWRLALLDDIPGLPEGSVVSETGFLGCDLSRALADFHIGNFFPKFRYVAPSLPVPYLCRGSS